VNRLLADGHEVTALVHRVVDDDLFVGRPTFKKGSVENANELVRACKGVEVVCHLVGLIAETRTQTFEGTVAQGTANVAAACRGAGVRRIVYLSAVGTSAEAPSKYHQTKYRAEQAVIESGLEYVILRPSVIYGPGDGFVSMLDSLLKYSPVTPVIGSGRYRLQPIFIDDVVEIMVRSLTSTKATNQIIEVGGPEKLEYLEILDIIKAVTGRTRMNFHLPTAFMKLMAGLLEALVKPAPLTRDQLIMMEMENVLDTTEMTQLFGLQPLTMAEGLRRYIRKQRWPKKKTTI
jgi:NADH dehydrogenase